MVFKTSGGKWVLCPTCQQIMFTASKLPHKCPPKVKKMIEQEIEDWVEYEMLEFNEQLDGFWQAPDVKFWRYLLDKGEEL